MRPIEVVDPRRVVDGVHLGQHQVQDDRIERPFLGTPKTGVACVFDLDLEALGAEPNVERMSDIHLIFDDQNAHDMQYRRPLLGVS
jgi:hypothetical protein